MPLSLLLFLFPARKLMGVPWMLYSTKPLITISNGAAICLTILSGPSMFSLYASIYLTLYCSRILILIRSIVFSQYWFFNKRKEVAICVFILLDVGWSCQCTVSSRGLMLHISSCKSAFLAMLCIIVFHAAWFFFIFLFLREFFLYSHHSLAPLAEGIFFSTMHTLVWHILFFSSLLLYLGSISWKLLFGCN